MKKFFLLIAVFFAACLFVHADALNSETLHKQLEEEVVKKEIPLLVPTPGQKLIARSVIWTMMRFHYTHPNITPELCSQWYENYFLFLDPSKCLFLQSDMEEFRHYENSICLKNQPNLDFAFLVYQRFLQRLRECCIYAFEEYDKPFSFDAVEFLPTFDKPEEHDWPKTVDERNGLWHLRVKNVLLADKLKEEDLARRQSEAPKETEGARPVVYTPPPIRLRSQKALINNFTNRLNADPIEVLGNFLNSFATLLDPHSCYFPPAVKDDFDISMSLSLQGIGATLTARDGYTVVVSLVPGGPAARDGRLKPGDKILAVAQSATEEPFDTSDIPIDKVVKRIRGPKGTHVFLTIQPEATSTEYVLDLCRDEIKLKDSEAQSKLHEIDGKRILCIYLPSFYKDFNADVRDASAKSTTTDVLKLLHDALAAGPVDGVILDMRGNGGGALDETVQLSGAFLKNRGNAIVQTRDSNGSVDVRYRSSSSETPEYSGPLMLMVDRGAASATEIMAACLQDTRRAVIVGDEGTHGKGSVQTVMDIANTPAMRLNSMLLGNRETGSVKVTVQKFYRINGGSTQIKGVTPDICFPSVNMASRSTEGDLPHVLPWDEIEAVPYTIQTGLEKYLPELQQFLKDYAAESKDFQKYSEEVKEYLAFRDMKNLPLEINARREFRNQELEAVRQIRHYSPNRTDEDRERLHDEDEAIYDDGGPRQDVILDAALAIMGKMIDINEASPAKPFSVK
ncbi:MAG: carboxy terminal-processing peptidase [Lentisphaeria bacterium]|nr:carboxy terminal-processing peptidase [Lentisphaeria bacterium]